MASSLCCMALKKLSEVSTYSHVVPGRHQRHPGPGRAARRAALVVHISPVLVYTSALLKSPCARADLDDTNGIQGLDERRDVLRLESLILLVQLHLRKALQAREASRRRLCY